MHDTALATGKLFFELYCATGRVLDVGSMDLNGSLRSVAPAAVDYTGLDIEPGPGVDVVSKPGVLPFDAGRFDAVVSTSCFEHDGAFWETLEEMATVTREGGYIYVSAPSNGHYHAHPIDAWRFYPDAGLALERWINGSAVPQHLVLVESFIARQSQAEWNDMVMVFRRGTDRKKPPAFISDTYPCNNVRQLGRSGLLLPSEQTQEQMQIYYLAKTSTALLGRWRECHGQPDAALERDTQRFLASFAINR